jgi:hypothetical protein
MASSGMRVYRRKNKIFVTLPTDFGTTVLAVLSLLPNRQCFSSYQFQQVLLHTQNPKRWNINLKVTHTSSSMKWNSYEWDTFTSLVSNTASSKNFSTYSTVCSLECQFIFVRKLHNNFNLFCVHLIHWGYDPSDMELVGTENKVTNIINDMRYNTIIFKIHLSRQHSNYNVIDERLY